VTRRELLAGAGALAAAQNGPESAPVRLIAHRGGVIEAGRAENSAAAMQEAIRRRYWMLEIDLRPTRDGGVVLHHDATLEKRFGDARRPEDLTLAECRALRGAAGDRLLTLEEAGDIAAGRTRFMLDVKGDRWPDAALARMERALAARGLLADAWVLGGEAAKRQLEGRASLSVGREALQRLLDNGEPVERLFLFELGSAMDEESVALARSVRIPAVAAINTFRYTLAKADEEKGPAADIARLRALGVTDFQIDSRYGRYFGQ
jgi:glycerophosphoryl diester phosphodiesterase